MFVGCVPPAEVSRRLTDAARAIDDARLRVLDPDTIHLTLVFVGDVEPADSDRLGETVARAAGGLRPMRLTPHALEPLPGAAAPRLVAAVAECPPGLAELQRRLASRLCTPRARRRPYRPHLTVARWPGGAGPRPAPPMPPLPLDVGFDVDHVILFRSRLRPTGAIHEVVHRVALERR